MDETYVHLHNSTVLDEQLLNRSYRDSILLSTLLDSISMPDQFMDCLYEGPLYKTRVYIDKIIVTESNCEIEYYIKVRDVITDCSMKFTKIYEQSYTRKRDGYIYFVSPKNSNKDEYKIGMTKNPNRLISRYGKTTDIYIIYPIDDENIVEELLKRLFERKYDPVKGREYFKGNRHSMVYYIVHVIGLMSKVERNDQEPDLMSSDE